MCHKLPSMLSNRVFPVLVLTAKTGQHDFIVVQVPVDIRCVGEAMYSNGRNLMAGNSKIKREKTVIGYEESFTPRKEAELTKHQCLHKY